MQHEPRPHVLRVTEDSFAALIRLFRQSSKWTAEPPIGYAPTTKINWGRELNLMSRPTTLGALSIQEIRPSLVQAYFDGLAEWPGKQEIGLAVLRQLERWAIVRDLLPRQITTGIEIGESDGGHIPWSDEQVELAEREAAPHLARAVTLAANTGQRASDLVRMGWTDIETHDGVRGIVVKRGQQKTGRYAWIPITAELDAAMAKWERRPGPFLTRPSGHPWTPNALAVTWGQHRNRHPALAPLRLANLSLEPGVVTRKDKGLVIHGLRGTACVRLRRAGATEIQIADMIVMSVQMVKRYCRFSVQRENAVAAVHHLDRTFAERLARKSSENRG